MGDRHDPAYVGHAGAGRSQQVELHGEHDLALHEELGLERERVEGDVHRALDRVLDGHDGEVDLAPLDGGEGVGHRPHGHELLCRQVGLGEESLFGKRPGWAEKCDLGHDRAGY